MPDDAVVLDFFAGSGTTGHAVALPTPRTAAPAAASRVNSAEPTREGSNARLAGLLTRSPTSPAPGCAPSPRRSVAASTSGNDSQTLTPGTAGRHDESMAAGGTRDLVGREGELATLAASADRARAGTTTTVVVTGDAGIGKSRLVAEATARMRATGAIVATGNGVDLAEGALPYGVVGQVVRGLRSAVGAHRLVEILGSQRQVLGWLDPGLAATDTAPPERASLFTAVEHLVTELAGERLLCLVLEDLHWADLSRSTWSATWPPPPVSAGCSSWRLFVVRAQPAWPDSPRSVSSDARAAAAGRGPGARIRARWQHAGRHRGTDRRPGRGGAAVCGGLIAAVLLPVRAPVARPQFHCAAH